MKVQRAIAVAAIVLCLCSVTTHTQHIDASGLVFWAWERLSGESLDSCIRLG